MTQYTNGTSPTVTTIRAALNVLFAPGQVVELRIPKVDGKKTRTDSGYFDNFDALAKAAAKYDGRADGVYVTVNPCDDALLARAENRVKEWCDLATSDANIERRTKLPIDCDPKVKGKKRPAGVSSTDAEHEAAIAVARAVREWLDVQGWPAPIEADSGNGGALLYHIDLPNNDDSTALVRDVLEVIQARFNSDYADIDTSVHNAARIWKLYGTLAGKGDSTATRPHRRAAILSAPESPTLVSVEQLRAVARLKQPATTQAQQIRNGFDVGALLTRCNVGYKKGEHQNKTKYVLDACIFNPDHTAPDAAVIVWPDGKIGYECFHNGCQEHTWRDARAKIDPSYNPTYTNQNGVTIATAAPVTTVTDSPRFSVASEDALMNLPPLAFLDRDLCVVARAYHLIYGPSGSGKTFFAIERAMRLASAGYRVLYVPTEDLSGLRYRVAAWRKAHPEASGRLTWLQMPEGLDLQDHGQVADLLEAIEPYKYDLVTVDTLREAHSGDENSSQDTRRINRAMQAIISSGAAVDVIHHTGVAGERPRGSTALYGNNDVVLEVENDDGAVKVIFKKLRAPQRDPLTFGIVQQDTGLLDADGETVMSAILRPASQVIMRATRMSPTGKCILEALSLSIFAETGARTKQLVDAAKLSENRTFYRALSFLKDNGYISQGAKGDPYTITNAGRAQIGPELKSTVRADTASQSPTVTTVTPLSPTVTDSAVCPPVLSVTVNTHRVDSDDSRQTVTQKDTDSYAYRVAQAIHKPNVNMRIERGHVLEGDELARAMADGTDHTFSSFADPLPEDDDEPDTF